ncbi:MAG TPA: ATP-binding protein [Methylomirabilota bacterium]|nr:ATP-binding protein [Methylomirabilota bacterium]
MRPREAGSPGAPSVAPAASAAGLGEDLTRWLLTRTPLGHLVRAVAAIRTSVHKKLLAAFLLVVLLVTGMGLASLRIIAIMSQQSELMHATHKRVDASRQAQHALAMQMNFTAMALLLRDEATIARILRENNRFNTMLAQIEDAAPPDEREIIQKIRDQQGEAMATVADVANLVRDGKIQEAMQLQLTVGYPLFQRIEGLVDQVMRAEEAGMDRMRAGTAAANRNAIYLMAIFVGGSVALALLLGFVISWSFILPVRQAEGFLGRIAKGDFSTTVDVPNRDEFGTLAARMNLMSQELHRLYEDQRAAAHQLQTLNAQLQRASQAKSEFLANMSHELRTPMNAILGFTEMIEDQIYGEVPEAIRTPIHDIRTCGRQLLGLINDVLDLSKIEAGRMELSVAEYSVEQVLETVWLSLRSLAAEKGLDFVVECQPEIPPAYGDGKRITQCLTNLVGNALKFTKQGGVTVRAALRDGEVLYSVADTGIGIPTDQLAHVFGEFRQVDASISREFGGTGLGLSITKTFVEMHGGRIWVESELGKGSTFYFTIPLRVAEAEHT